jgi:hypothetical protein
MGLGADQYRGLPALDDSGGDYRIETKVELFPNQHFEFAVLCNEDSVVAGGRGAGQSERIH